MARPQHGEGEDAERRRSHDGKRAARHGPERPSLKGSRPRGLPGGVRLVFEDEHLIVVDKPPGLLTAGLPGQEIDSVFRYLKVHVRDQHKRRGTKVWIIHRLDKEASGLLVFAKTDRAYEFLKEEFRSKRAHRLYAAVVEGEMGSSGTPAQQHSSTSDGKGAGRRIQQALSGTIQSFLIEDEKGMVRSVDAPTAARGAGFAKGDHAKAAVTHWRVVATGKGRSLLQVRLETGRKNQIRVHMQEAGHPIVGDRRYGAATDPEDRVCLHAVELGFSHPVTGQSVRYSSPTPPLFWTLVGKSAPAADEVALISPVVGVDADRSKPPVKTEATKEPAKPAAPVAPVQKALPKDAGTKDVGPKGADDSSWDHVADWYTDLIEERKSDHHELVILPGAIRLLKAREGMRVLDIACGQGELCRRLSAQGVQAVGIDASPKLIEAARRQAGGAGPAPEFVVGDARGIAGLDAGEFDAATCVMALMNMDPLSPVLEGVAGKLKSGGVFVVVLLHPAFRAPGQTSWGWDGETRNAERGTRKGRGPERRSEVTQYRRVDGYLSAGQTPIVMNPGGVARGQAPVTTMTYHRPIQAYVNALAKAGLLVDAMEEWASLRQSEPGPRAAEENRARREIPMFLALRGVKTGG